MQALADLLLEALGQGASGRAIAAMTEESAGEPEDHT